MAINQPKQYLICYDITDHDRLAAVHRYLSRQAMHVQYSVFTAYMTALKVQALMAGLEQLIDARTDDVRCYPLPATLQVDTLGRQSGLQEGLLLLLDGKDLSGVKSVA